MGYNKKPINNTLVSAKSKGKIGIMFPGINYTCQTPLLYNVTNVLLDRGYDVLQVDYDYRNDDFSMASPEERKRWLDFDSEAAYEAAISFYGYKTVMLVGKSLGSFALANLNFKKKIDKSVWLTPLLEKSGAVELDLYPKIKKTCRSGLFVIGTADSLYNKGRVDELQRFGAKFKVFDGADHRMEIEGNRPASLKVLKEVSDAIADFSA